MVALGGAGFFKMRLVVLGVALQLMARGTYGQSSTSGAASPRNPLAGARAAADSDALLYTAFDDMSWAINERVVSTGLGTRQRDLYRAFLTECAKLAGPRHCSDQENWRLQMNMYQPRSVVNYTATGFSKLRVPAALFKQILTFWEINRDQQVEEWPERVSTYHNSWTAPTSIVRIENDTLPGGGDRFASHISNSLRPVLEEWTGMKLASTSAYGVRVYKDGSILAPHVDRLPLVTSVIINVAQDVHDPWPLEIYDHDGVAHNVTMQPGDMILYESHSAIHGRPFPLNGSCFANICTCHGAHCREGWAVFLPNPSH
jgi:prolyl 4-hydroxylase